MNLVEDHHGDSREFGVALQTAGEHSFGEHFDSRRRPDHAFVAGP